MRLRLTLLALAILAPPASWPQSLRFRPEVTTEARFFGSRPQFDQQLRSVQGSLVLQGELQWVAESGRATATIEPYIRLDAADDDRTYVDFREASFARSSGDWSVLVGFSRVFWGVAESRNVVDIVNQFDTIEDFDQGEKLGQPMIRVSRRLKAGSLEALYLPYFRKQLFPGSEGRLRAGVVSDRAQFQRAGDEWAGDFALRYSATLGSFDFGTHLFHGTNRFPLLLASPSTDELTPFYQERSQAGLDVQYTTGPWLLKLEVASVQIDRDDFFSAVGGIEYTFFGVGSSALDLGVIAEFLHDGRDLRHSPFNPFDRDAFAGARISLNDPQDTQILAGAIIDTRTNGVIATAELERRVGERMVFELEARYFDANEDPFLGAFESDSHVTLRLRRFL
ncbi:MAG: hypothetical protein AAGA81_01420 [Acidobacteriota bacterium]